LSIEHKFIDWIKRACDSPSHERVVLGVGDDAAIVDHGDQLTVVSTDLVADKVHFVVGETPNHLIGRKALAVNLSDLAAIAATPVSVVVSFLLPRSMGLEQAQEIFQGLKQLADQFAVAVVGGDTNCHEGPLVINCAVMGVVPRGRASTDSWRMASAKAGDAILVSGEFGGSITGRHLTFEPRIELASYLAGKYMINAATDITDSLAIDLETVARKSGGGVRISLEDIPISEAARKLEGEVNIGGQASVTVPVGVAAALFDGEDFELAISVSEETAEKILTDGDCPGKMKRVGTITQSASFEIVDKDGRVVEIVPRGYEH
jgi:thiamine-monophosphate kinase